MKLLLTPVNPVLIMAFPEAEISVIPVDCYGFTRDNWYTQEYGIDRVLGELARCGNQFVGDMKEYLKDSAYKS